PLGGASRRGGVAVTRFGRHRARPVARGAAGLDTRRRSGIDRTVDPRAGTRARAAGTGVQQGVSMAIKSDRWIREMCVKHRMIEPFEDKQVRDGVISYGISSYGYDLRIADEFKIFTNVNSTIVDPKAVDPASMVDFRGQVAIIPPNSFALGRSVEYFRVPRDVLCTCVGKSTYARCGIIT